MKSDKSKKHKEIRRQHREIRKKRSETGKQRMFVIKQLVSREIKRKYARSYLGIVWSVLNPLLSMAVLSMIFSTMFRRSIENFPIYYLTGMIIWQMFSISTTTAMTALEDNKQLLLKVKITKETFVLARVYTALTNFGYTCIAYIFMLLVFRVKPNVFMLLLPVDVFFLTLFSLGFSYILSILYVFFADIKHLYTVLLTLWMYMSAIFYPVESVPESMARVIEANPMYAYILFARECVLEGKCPSVDIWIRCIVWGVAAMGIGYLVFRKKEAYVMQKL